jgi:hypothetical protein
MTVGGEAIIAVSPCGVSPCGEKLLALSVPPVEKCAKSCARSEGSGVCGEACISEVSRGDKDTGSPSPSEKGPSDALASESWRALRSESVRTPSDAKRSDPPGLSARDDSARSRAKDGRRPVAVACERGAGVAGPSNGSSLGPSVGVTGGERPLGVPMGVPMGVATAET